MRGKERHLEMKKKRILQVVIAIAAVFLGWLIISKIIGSGRGSGGRPGVLPVAVEITPIEKATIRDTGSFTGTLEPKSQFVIAPKISGRLEQLPVNIGDTIRRGQLLAVLDDEEYNQAAIQAQADLRVARANLEEAEIAMDVARRELERVQELHKRGISADSELDAVKGTFAAQESGYKVAQAQVANKEAALRSAEVRLSYTRITAAWESGSDRVVGERYVNQGALLAANSPILSLLEIDPLIAVVYISDKDYLRVQTGQHAVIRTDALPDREVPGRVARIAPMLKETSREARIEIELRNPERLLKPGMFIQARLEFDAHENATVVPTDSLVKRSDQTGIFLADLENKKAVFVPVATGITGSRLTEILEPADLSGHVITLGHHLLVPDSPILLPETGNKENREPAGGTGETR